MELSLFNSVGKKISNQIIKSHFDKKRKMLQDCILSEFRQGDFSRASEDDLIGIYYRLYRDAMEGVAKNNLRLMCRVIQGMYDKDKLKSKSFLRFANILSDLSEEEIVFLGEESKEKEHSFTQDDLGRSKEISNKNRLLQGLLRTGFFTMDINTYSEAIKAGSMGLSEGLPDPQEDKVETETQMTFTATKLFEELLKYADLIIKDNQ